ncbi:MAG: hypothetical protein ACKO5C_00855 [Ferruginibacter sp.]
MNCTHTLIVRFLSGSQLTTLLLLMTVFYLSACNDSTKSAPTTALETANTFIRDYLSGNKKEALNWISKQDATSLSVLDSLITKLNTLDARSQRNLQNTPVTILSVNDQRNGDVLIRYLDPIYSSERLLQLQKKNGQWIVRFDP